MLIRFLLNLQRAGVTINDAKIPTIHAADYAEAQLAGISLVIALTIFTDTFDRNDDTAVEFPPANRALDIVLPSASSIGVRHILTGLGRLAPCAPRMNVIR